MPKKDSLDIVAMASEKYTDKFGVVRLDEGCTALKRSGAHSQGVGQPTLILSSFLSRIPQHSPYTYFPYYLSQNATLTSRHLKTKDPPNARNKPTKRHLIVIQSSTKRIFIVPFFPQLRFNAYPRSAQV